MSWIYENSNNLLYFISNNFTYKPSVAIFSLNNTLIHDSIAKEKITYMQLNNNVQNCLNQINDNDCSIVIIENGIKISKENLKLITKKFFDLIDNENNQIPFIIMFPMKNNKFQKPYTHIFVKLQDLYKAHDKAIINDKSIVIGNMAGRFKTSIFCSDINDHDRAFAHNINMTFKTPNQFLNNDNTPRQWNWHNNIINKIINEQKNLVEPEFINMSLQSDQKHIIFISGPPTSGKTLLGNRIKTYLNTAIIFDINNFINSDQMILAITDTIDISVQSLIIIDTLESDTKRNAYLEKLKNKNYKINFIEIDINRKLCEFLNIFRLQISKNIFDAYAQYVYTNYYRYYKPLSQIQKDELDTYIKFPLLIRSRKEIFFHF